MAKRYLILAVLPLLLVSAVAPAEGPVTLGGTLPAVSLPDYYGHTFNLADYWNRPPQDSSNPQPTILVLVFFGINCPRGRVYDDRVNDFYARYAVSGVQVFGIDAYPKETPEEVRVTAAERRIVYPILMDPQGVMIDILGARRTTTTYVIDGKGVLRYRGSFDNARALDDPERIPYAERAVEAVLLGQQPVIGDTPASGCGLRRED